MPHHFPVLVQLSRRDSGMSELLQRVAAEARGFGAGCP